MTLDLYVYVVMSDGEFSQQSVSSRNLTGVGGAGWWGGVGGWVGEVGGVPLHCAVILCQDSLSSWVRPEQFHDDLCMLHGHQLIHLKQCV